MSNNSHYAYYSFPPTPNRSSPAAPSPKNTPSSQTARKPPKMAPSPAAGRSSDQPKTPTKLGRKPQSQQTSRLGQQKGTPGKSGAPKLNKPQEEATEAADNAKGEAEDKAEDSKVEMKDQSELGGDEAEDAAGKASDLKEQAPQPIEEGEEEAEGQAEDAQEKVQGATDDAEDEGDNLTEKAGDTADDTEDTADSAQDTAGKATNGAQKSGGGLLGAGKNAAGKAQNVAGAAGKAAQDPSKAGEAGQEAAGEAQGAAEDAQEGAEKAGDEAEEAAEETANGAKETADEAGEEGAEKVGETVDGAKDTAEDAQEEGEDATGQKVPGLDNLELLRGRVVSADGKINDDDGNQIGQLVEGDAEDLEGYEIGDDGEILDDDGDLVGRCELTPEAHQAALDRAQEAAEGPSLSFMQGLTVSPDGNIYNDDGDAVGQLTDGNPAELEGYEVNDSGEILDEDGDVVGRVKIHPDYEETAQQLQDEAEEAGGKVPDIDALKGLSVSPDGNIYNEDGDTIGQLVDGNPDDLQGMEFNEEGEIVDEDGNVIGKAQIHPDAPELGDAAKDAEDGVDGVADDAEEAAEGAEDQAEEAGDEVEGELPGVEALEGQELNEDGEIVDDEGNVLARVEDGVNPEDVAGLKVNESGEVVDSEGNVIGKVELAEGAAEKLKEALPVDIRALEGYKVNKKGKVLDEDGEEIGHVTEGEVKDLAGKFINDKGEVVDKKGNPIGKVDITPGEAADNALAALKERLGEQEDQLPEEVPDLDVLDGLKVNKKGQILNEDGEPIGELTEGDLAQCAGKKCNDKGEVLDKDGNVIGKVRALPQAVEEAEEEGEGEPEMVERTPELDILEGRKVSKKGQIFDDEGEPIGELIDGDLSECAGKKVNDQGEVLDSEGNVIGHVKALPQEVPADEVEAEGEGEQEEEENNLPPLSVLEGLTVNKQGKLIDSNGTIVGELVEGDAKKLSKMGVQSDDQGQFWDNKGHVIGRAQTVPVEEPDEEAPFAGLEGLIVVEGGYVQDENGNTVGQVVEGDAKKLIGRAVDEDGDILDKKGSVVGHADRLPDEEVPEEEAPADLSFLEGMSCNKQGNVIGNEGVPVARLSEGNPKECAGKPLDDQGQIFNDRGRIIGRVELIPDEEKETKPEGPFAGLVGLRVIEGGKIADEDGNVVGEIVEGNPKRLVGLQVDEDGDIVDRHGTVKGHAEPLPEEEEPEPEDLSILDGKVLNKRGYVVDENGLPLGRLVEGNVDDLAGRKSDGEGLIHNDTGKVVGRCELIPESERAQKQEGPFAGFEGLRVVKEGKVEDADGNVVGEIIEGNPKRLVGHTVEEDGDIIDKYGNTIGRAVPYEEPEEEAVDLSALAGCTVNKAGNVVTDTGRIMGHVAEGDPKQMIGKKVDGQGQIWDNAGNVIGRAELSEGVDTTEEGPFEGFDQNTVKKDGTVQLPDGTIIGRVTEGDILRLEGHTVDPDGDITDKNGNTIGKAERWAPEEKERTINPMAGRRVNKEGEVRDENGDVMGRLTAGDLGHCVGLEIDDNGYVVDNDGNKVGEVTLLENIVEEEEEEETDEERQKREDAEIADKMANICQQTLERVQPVCAQITEVSHCHFPTVVLKYDANSLSSSSTRPTRHPRMSSTRSNLSTTSSLLSKKVVASYRSATAPFVASILTDASRRRPRVVRAARRPHQKSTVSQICSRRSHSPSSQPSTTRRRRSTTCLMPRRSSTLYGVFLPSRSSRSLLRLDCCLQVCLVWSASSLTVLVWAVLSMVSSVALVSTSCWVVWVWVASLRALVAARRRVVVPPACRSSGVCSVARNKRFNLLMTMVRQLSLATDPQKGGTPNERSRHHDTVLSSTVFHPQP